MQKKKDIAEAFGWLWIAVEDCYLFAADFHGRDFGLPGLVTALYLALTFGWTGATGEWMAFAWLMKCYHAAWRPLRPQWDGRFQYSSFFLMDDQVLIEACLGRRPFMSILIAEEGARRSLGKGAHNLEMDAAEGDMEVVKLVWGIALQHRAPLLLYPQSQGGESLSPAAHGGTLEGLH